MAAAYNTRLNQASLQYTFSHFHDNNSFVNLPYPYSNTAAPFQQSAAYSTPPSNSAHYLTLMTATNAVPNTRINLNLRVGLEMQNDMFAPDTADPNPHRRRRLSNLNPAWAGNERQFPQCHSQGFPGQAQRGFASDRQYRRPRLLRLRRTQRQPGTSTRSIAAVPAARATPRFTSAYYVVPQDWLKQNAGGEVGYRILPQYDTKLTVGYRFDIVDRSNAQVGKSTTNTGTVALSSRLGPQVNSSLSYEHADRSGVLNYLTPWANLAGPASAGPDPTPAPTTRLP